MTSYTLNYATRLSGIVSLSQFEARGKTMRHSLLSPEWWRLMRRFLFRPRWVVVTHPTSLGHLLPIPGRMTLPQYVQQHHELVMSVRVEADGARAANLTRRGRQ